MNKHFMSLCTPAKIYFALAVIACIIALYNNMPILAVLMKLGFAFIWTYGLNWLCSKGYKSISWLLVLLPYIIIVLAMFRMINLAKIQPKQSQMQLIHQSA